MPSDRKKPELTSSRITHSYPRKRALAACSTCRVRKIKCNNAQPICSSCESSGAQCIYEDHGDLSKFDPASLLILKRLDQVLDKLNQVPGSGTVSAALHADPATSAFPNLDQQSNGTESWADQLSIPEARIGPDTVLAWPVFGGQFDQGLFNKSVAYVLPHDADMASQVDECPEILWQLVENFLQHVHIKNLVLNVDRIRDLTAEAIEHGLTMENSSCLLLIICALGCFAKPFETDAESGAQERSSHELSSIRIAQKYHQAAMKRLGSLVCDTMAVQCWFFSGVYQMYIVKPLEAWRYFSQASAILFTVLHIHDATEFSEYPDEMVALYWTCWKSEIDLRAELSLPNSVLSTVTIRKMHPSQPQSRNGFELNGNMPTTQSKDGLDFQRLQHYAWLYYRSDITLKRLECQVLKTFYKEDSPRWGKESIPYLTRMTRRFESQVDKWLQSLPERDQLGHEWDTVPKYELSFHLQARILELKSWLYRPFVYIAVHYEIPPAASHVVVEYVQKAIACSFHIGQAKPIRHRHHGTWLALRMVLSTTFAMLAALKVGGLVDYLVDWRDVIEDAAAAMEYWEEESPDMAKGKEIIRYLLKQIDETRHSGGSEGQA